MTENKSFSLFELAYVSERQEMQFEWVDFSDWLDCADNRRIYPSVDMQIDKEIGLDKFIPQYTEDENFPSKNILDDDQSKSLKSQSAFNDPESSSFININSEAKANNKWLKDWGEYANLNVIDQISYTNSRSENSEFFISKD